MLKNDICIPEIGQAVLEIFHFKVRELEFLLRSPEKVENNTIHDIFSDLLVTNL